MEPPGLKMAIERAITPSRIDVARAKRLILETLSKGDLVARHVLQTFSPKQLLTQERDSLRGIMVQGVGTLKQSGAESEARRLERALDGR